MDGKREKGGNSSGQEPARPEKICQLPRLSFARPACPTASRARTDTGPGFPGSSDPGQALPGQGLAVEPAVVPP